MLYKLTKGSLSRIRKNKAGIDELKEDGYTLDGEVNEKYEIIDANPVFDYKNMSVKELRTILDEHGVDHTGMKKADILELLV